MQGVLGLWAIFYGALLLRLRIKRFLPRSEAFFIFRQQWNLAIQRAFRFQVNVQGTHARLSALAQPPCLIVCNHEGFADINVLVVSLPAAFKPIFISKKEIGDIPVFGWHMRHYGDILFDRKDKAARKQVRFAVEEAWQQGLSVVLFPEGTRQKQGYPAQVISPLLITQAIEQGILIIPVAIKGTMNLIEQPFDCMRKSRSSSSLDTPSVRATKLIQVNYGVPGRHYRTAEEVWQTVCALHADFSRT